MALDWGLASVHHLAIFSLAAILAFELALTTVELDGRTILRLTRVERPTGAQGLAVGDVASPGDVREGPGALQLDDRELQIGRSCSGEWRERRRDIRAGRRSGHGESLRERARDVLGP